MEIARNLIANPMSSSLSRRGAARRATPRRLLCRDRARIAMLVAGSIALCAIDARTQEIRMRADIPFGFHVQDKVFEAGSYWIQVHREGTAAGGFPKRLEILSASPQSHVGAQFMLAVGTVYRPEIRVGSALLVFDSFAGVYALRNIWEGRGQPVPSYPSPRQNVSLPGKLSRIQSKLRRNIAGERIAHEPGRARSVGWAPGGRRPGAHPRLPASTPQLSVSLFLRTRSSRLEPSAAAAEHRCLAQTWCSD